MKDATFSSARLLSLYDRISDAPEAIPRLRRFVLDLAVRGKLVGQDAEDEQATELVKRLGKARRDQGGHPANWLSAKLGELLNLQYGKGLDAKLRQDSGPVPVFGSNGIVSYTVSALTQHPSIVVGRKGSAGALNLCNGPSWTTDVAYFVENPSFFSLRYLYNLLSSLNLGGLGKGVKPGLSRSDAYELLVLVPPLAEQDRIVAKFDELMELCDQLEHARAGREAVRDRLTTASLARLTAPDTDAETYPAHARFALQSLPTLTTRPDQIKTLRQTILNLAVRGKLVAQDAADEPAAELLKRIAKEKARLGVKRPPGGYETTDLPFGLPSGWALSSIGEVCSKTGSGSTPRGGKEVYADQGVAFLRSQNIYDDGLRLDDVACIASEIHERMAGTAVKPADLLLNITGGSMGRCCRIPNDFDEANVSQHVAIIRPAVRGMADFIHRLVLSPYFQAFIFGEQTGAGRGGLPKNRMDRIAVALPPLAEQHRIVARVDALMALCDQLEASLTTTATTRRTLLDALLHEALEPGEPLLEAAE